jgi:DNA-binding CsgD family transcriptional regulator
MNSLIASERLRLLMNFMLGFPTREQLVVYLSENICPSGELAGVSTAHLGDAGVIDFEFFYGFRIPHPVVTSIHISDDDPTAETFRTQKVQIVELRSIYGDFTNALEMPGITDYTLGVSFPITSKRVYCFAFMCDLETFTNYSEYFECVRSIITFWETFKDSKTIKELAKPEYINNSLTPRQEQILELINDGKTNATIAMHLGYSESLIRQETIIIYRKLGVSGRRELKTTIAS